MGRGRQKAKQTKVARQLKYYSPETDYRALEKELVHGPGPLLGTSAVDTDDDEGDDDEWEPAPGR
ncbi:DUF3073 domain-containing protein [Serinibacter arcticus]|uniref:DUF3073 domain-containing protein n=1 Tax=Serinibacter arcticus TaxID=1655435 RepID=A0A2U2A040_9MICO|nr:DUF3073 domain-containing protein [Serinibacter arcticus]PWD52586.1 DUF3073 domain-containing protein [Serinibacter arcticus]